MEPQKSRIRPVESSQSLSSVGNLIGCSAPRACNVDLPYWMQKNWWRGVWKYIADPDDSGMPEKTSTPSIDALFWLSFERMLRSAGCVVCNAKVATNLMYGYTIHLNAQVTLQAFNDLLEQSTWRRTIEMWKSFPTRTTNRIWFENKHY